MKADEVMAWAKQNMKKHRLPEASKPTDDDPEIDFPDDPDRLTSNRLGQLMLRFTAFTGWALRLYGLADSEYALVESEYSRLVHSRGIEKRKTLGRVAADVVEAAVLADADAELNELYERKLKLQTVRTQLDNRIKTYEKYYSALSRELSRRELEARTA